MPFFAYAVALTWAVQHDPFFWDTVQLASKHAHHFYQNGLHWLPLPQEIDSGHPPVFGYYLALIWTFFGKTLLASHWAMLPFLLLNIWLLYRIGLRLGGVQWAFWLIPIALLDPVLASQNVLVSPDVVLVCGFLFAIEGIAGKNKIFTTAGILILCMISVRGMMTAGALFAWQMLCALLSSRQSLSAPRMVSDFIKTIRLRDWLPFLPGFAFAAWFLWWHNAATGWTGLHPNSPWAPTFEPAKGLELLRNLLVVGWRWLDFGRLVEWMVLAWLAVYALRSPAHHERRVRNGDKYVETPRSFGTERYNLILLLLCLFLFLSPSALFFKNVSAHRYFLPGFVVLHLLVFQWIVAWSSGVRRSASVVFGVVIVVFALGHFWIYPRGVAMGWDATLAHLSYHRLRAEAVAFLEKENIDFQKVGSFFPNLNTGENLMLNGDGRRFADKDFARNEYIFASNIFNDLSETDDSILRRDWVLIKKWKQAGVWIELYKR